MTRDLVIYDLGIFAPYTWDDVTYLACNICDMMETLGGSISFMSSQSHDRNVHFRYDKAVINGKRASFRSWAEQCRNLLWFDVQPSRLEIAKRAGCRNIWVPLLHRLEPQDFEHAVEFDTILCMSEAVEAVIKRKAFQAETQRLDWDSGLPLTSKTRPSDQRELRVYAPIDSATAKEEGLLYACLFRVLLDALPHLHLTVAATRHWRRPTLSAFFAIQDKFEDRFTLLRKPDHFKRMEAYRAADWVFCGSIRESSMLSPLEALAFGCPVIAFDAQPISEMIRHLHNGYLIPCGAAKTTMGVPRIRINTKEMLDTLLAAIGDKGILTAMQAVPWPELETRRRAFLSYWRRLIVAEEEVAVED